MPDGFVPDRDGLVWLQFDPHAGHEQASRRPALVLSPRSYNAASGLVCLNAPEVEERRAAALILDATHDSRLPVAHVKLM